MTAIGLMSSKKLKAQYKSIKQLKPDQDKRPLIIIKRAMKIESPTKMREPKKISFYQKLKRVACRISLTRRHELMLFLHRHLKFKYLFKCYVKSLNWCSDSFFCFSADDETQINRKFLHSLTAFCALLAKTHTFSPMHGKKPNRARILRPYVCCLLKIIAFIVSCEILKTFFIVFSRFY